MAATWFGCARGIVDPYQKGVMVVTANRRRWVTDTLTCPELLPGFSVNVQDIFGWLGAPKW
ncbi:hypothetical protein L0337_40255 [candidate division KSB1 bacterium]|nr:hypothetical protein [candidate division KSB1 bacterium]